MLMMIEKISMKKIKLLDDEQVDNIDLNGVNYDR